MVYAATAFVVLQAADIMLPRLGIPDWAMSLIVVLVVLGFPVALVLTWALELKPDGGVPPAARRDQSKTTRPAGPTYLMIATYLSVCGAPFDLGETPNLGARLREAGLNWPTTQPVDWPLKDW